MSTRFRSFAIALGAVAVFALATAATVEARRAGAGQAGAIWAFILDVYDSIRLQQGETVSNAVDGTVKITRNTNAAITLQLADSSGGADATIANAGAGSMTYGTASTTGHVFTTDGTGTAEAQFPAGSIDGTEILDDTIAAIDLDSADFGDWSCTTGTCTTDNGSIGIADLASVDFGDWTCNGTTCTTDNGAIAPAELADADYGAFTVLTGAASIDTGAVSDSDLASNYSGVGACGAGQFVSTLNDNAAPTCSADDDQPDSDAEVPDAITVNGGTGEILVRSHATDCTAITDGVANECCLELDSDRIYCCEPSAGACDTAGEWYRYAATASALDANGSNCSAGTYPAGVDASGAAESCTAIRDTDLDAEDYGDFTCSGLEDGCTINNVERSIALPLGSWISCTTALPLNTSAVDDEPDFAPAGGNGIGIEYDIIGGSVDAGPICNSVTVPPEYASGGALRIRAANGSANVGNLGQITCLAWIDGAAAGATDTQTLANGTAAQTLTVTPAGTYAAGKSAAIGCLQSNATADDAVMILSAEWFYTATK